MIEMKYVKTETVLDEIDGGNSGKEALQQNSLVNSKNFHVE